MNDTTPVEAHGGAPLEKRLEAYLQQGSDKAFHVSNLTPISDGWETEVYAFTLTRRRGKSSEMILRMYPGTNAAETCSREFKGMKGVYLLGYPVPYVTEREKDSEWLGKPFLIMHKIDGQPLGDLMREASARQPELLSRFVQLAVDLHSKDNAPFVWKEPQELQDNPSAWIPALLSRWRTRILTHLQQAWAAPIFDWLDAHAPEAAQGTIRLSPLHGDFHPHNVLITADDQLYVIDWSGFSVGDYRSDHAWTLLLISSSGYPQLRDLILSEYARLAGLHVDNIEYFDVLAALRRLVDLAVSLGSGAESLGMRPETAAAMRAQQQGYQYVYSLLHDRTGIRIPSLEALIASLSA